MKDITLAIGCVFLISLGAMWLVESTEIVSVVSYCVTAIAGLATGNAIGKPKE